MRWLIAEDALRDRNGHWLEYIRSFSKRLRELGDDVTVLADKNAEPYVKEQLPVNPILPDSIWHRMSDGAPVWERYMRVPVHAWKTWHAVKLWIDGNEDCDLIFVPTVSVHHLLGWFFLIKGRLKRKRTRVLLNFIHLPFKVSTDGDAAWIPSPTARLFRRLIQQLGPEIRSGRVILGVETETASFVLTRLTSLPVRCLPVPVDPFFERTDCAENGLLLACFGGARAEKGSELLQLSIGKYLQRHPQSQVRFLIHWVADFENAVGDWVAPDPDLAQSGRVEYLRVYLDDRDYASKLGQTHVLVLPYRRSSYDVRGSRVIAEAVIHGIPVITTRGTTLAAQVEQFGAAVLCEDGDVESLVQAIETVEQNYLQLKARAEERKIAAREHFSVSGLRQSLSRVTNFT